MKPTAQLVFDGESLTIPPDCGEPAPNQMQGQIGELLAELSGRECYDSLGVGRDSVAFHAHVLEVGHLSVYEHWNFTLEVEVHNMLDALVELVNRPGVYVRMVDADVLRITMNARCLLDWHKWETAEGRKVAPPAVLVSPLREVVPNIAKGITWAPPNSWALCASWREPEHPEEEWISLRLAGSRGFSHEQVRHGDRTAMSQRSTRYVDESESDWCLHPLVHRLIAGMPQLQGRIDRFIEESRDLYMAVVNTGQPYLMDAGVDKGTARKQARGAARGFLGNALGTSLIFSASVAQWRRMMALRAHPAADAEIREVSASIVECLKRTVFRRRFDDMVLVPSPDGIGQVLADGFQA